MMGNGGSKERVRDLTPVPHPLDEELELAQGTADRLRGRFGSGLEAQIFSSGAGMRCRVGSTPQISLAYWAMVRSLENLPDVALGLLCEWDPHLPPHSNQGRQSPANPWPRTPHLVQGTDSFLAFNVLFIIRKDFKPGGEWRSGKVSWG